MEESKTDRRKRKKKKKRRRRRRREGEEEFKEDQRYGKYEISMVLGMETKILVWKYGFLWINVDFVSTLLDFSMELTKVCVELVWRLCFGVEFVWILNFWFYSYFWGDFGIDCKMVLCRVFGMFGVVFVACFVASIGRILWPVDKGCSRMVSGQKLACT